jgi:5-methylcytosine-specific restriction endonuclease McrA
MGNIIPNETSTCLVCGKEFQSKHNSANKACTRECGFIYIRQTKAAIKKDRELFVRLSNKNRLKPFSKSGAQWMSKAFCPLPEPKPKAPPHLIKHCAYCYTEIHYTFGSPRVYCSNRCHKLNIKHMKICDPEYILISRLKKRKIRAITGAKSTARARARNAGVYYESVSTANVFDRYGYSCAACGIDTPKSKRGKVCDNAPEIDHIIPLSKGGSHTLWNLQVLCRKCNGLKGGMFNNEFILKHLVNVSH